MPKLAGDASAAVTLACHGRRQSATTNGSRPKIVSISLWTLGHRDADASRSSPRRCLDNVAKRSRRLERKLVMCPSNLSSSGPAAHGFALTSCRSVLATFQYFFRVGCHQPATPSNSHLMKALLGSSAQGRRGNHCGACAQCVARTGDAQGSGPDPSHTLSLWERVCWALRARGQGIAGRGHGGSTTIYEDSIQPRIA